MHDYHWFHWRLLEYALPCRQVLCISAEWFVWFRAINYLLSYLLTITHQDATPLRQTPGNVSFATASELRKQKWQLRGSRTVINVTCDVKRIEHLISTDSMIVLVTYIRKRIRLFQARGPQKVKPKVANIQYESSKKYTMLICKSTTDATWA